MNCTSNAIFSFLHYSFLVLFIFNIPTELNPSRGKSRTESLRDDPFYAYHVAMSLDFSDKFTSKTWEFHQVEFEKIPHHIQRAPSKGKFFLWMRGQNIFFSSFFDFYSNFFFFSRHPTTRLNIHSFRNKWLQTKAKIK